MSLDWYCVFTRAQGERLAKEDLEAFGFEVLLPMREEWVAVPAHRRRPRPGQPRPPKRIKIERIMYPRYLFVGMLPHWRDFDGVMRSKRVLEILSDASGCPKRLPGRVVADLMTVAEPRPSESRSLAAARVAAWVGMRVTLKAGPFKGAAGVVASATRAGVRIEIDGPAGTAFPINVTLDQLALLDIFITQDDRQKRSTPLRVSAGP